jgi:Trm5-related predicted tRNA methylase
VKLLPDTFTPALLRVDFADEHTWQLVRDVTLRPLTTGAESHLAVIDDPEFDGLDLTGGVERPGDYQERILLVFDRVTREHPDHPLLLIDWLADEDEDDEERFIPRALRVIPSEVREIEVNLTLANMDFETFANSADADGIIRRFF